MRLAFDLDSRQLVNPDSLTGAVSSIKVRRGEVIPLDIQLVRQGVKVQEPGAEIEVYLVEEDDYTALLTSDTAVSGSGTGVETVFRATLDVDDAGIDALFTTVSQASATVGLEVRLTTASESYRSEPVEVTIQNSYTPS